MAPSRACFSFHRLPAALLASGRPSTAPSRCRTTLPTRQVLSIRSSHSRSVWRTYALSMLMPMRGAALRHPTAYRSLSSSPSSSADASPTPDTKSEGPVPPDYLNEAELHIFNKLKEALDPVRLEVQDVSGGCGSMYALEVVSSRFKGMPVIKQHKLVNQILAEEIKGWHGVQLRTIVP